MTDSPIKKTNHSILGFVKSERISKRLKGIQGRMDSLKKDMTNHELQIKPEVKFMADEQKPIESVDPFILHKPVYTLDDNVILSASTRTQIDEGLAKLRFHKTIYEDWNFGAVDNLGKSIILNFFGPPGTGKTLTAEAFAGTLQKSMIKLGISELESKFMGETSKNIQAVFKAAIEHDAVLFFDEADTLLGQRLSTVTQGIDNEVNAMRSTLLIELEKFSGIAIFATNFAKNYDEAFRSRISHHIHFELPDFTERKALWGRMIVDQIPLATEKEEMVSHAAEISDGFSGREIRTCMRLVLPKVLLEAETAEGKPMLSLTQLTEVIERVKHAKNEVASKRNGATTKDASISASKTMLGITENLIN